MTGDESGHWLGRGTWLIDRRHHRPRVGVITEVRERDRGMASRFGIQWRADTYQNLSLLFALEHLKQGDWVVTTTTEVKRRRSE